MATKQRQTQEYKILKPFRLRKNGQTRWFWPDSDKTISLYPQQVTMLKQSGNIADIEPTKTTQKEAK